MFPIEAAIIYICCRKPFLWSWDIDFSSKFFNLVSFIVHKPLMVKLLLLFLSKSIDKFSGSNKSNDDNNWENSSNSLILSSIVTRTLLIWFK